MARHQRDHTLKNPQPNGDPRPCNAPELCTTNDQYGKQQAHLACEGHYIYIDEPEPNGHTRPCGMLKVCVPMNKTTTRRPSLVTTFETNGGLLFKHHHMASNIEQILPHES